MSIIHMLVQTVFELFIFVCLVRSLLFFAGVPRAHPLVHFCMLLTQKLVRPFQKILPCVKGFETASLMLALLAACIWSVINLLWFQKVAANVTTIGMAILLGLVLWIQSILLTYIGVFIVMVILRLAAPEALLLPNLERICAPLMRPFKMLRIGMFDFSFLPFFICAQVVISTVLPYLTRLILSLY
ncbi:YggT family protein [Neisseria sp. Ec49-e6-T10]|uniref:YggT family protein n=1 Tax=Neisseria sp. Ec49-e6-T10 TaxID=3140744 RepID=UPI003EB85F85